MFSKHYHVALHVYLPAFEYHVQARSQGEAEQQARDLAAHQLEQFFEAVQGMESVEAATIEIPEAMLIRPAYARS